MKINNIFFSHLLVITLMLPTLAVASIPTKITNLFDVTKITSNSVIIAAPDIAESGEVVSIKINKVNNVDKDSVVTEIILFNDFRDEPVATFKLGNRMHASGLALRVKMRESGNIYAIAKLSNGKILTGEKLIKVTIGGCGGGGTIATSD